MKLNQLELNILRWAIIEAESNRGRLIEESEFDELKIAAFDDRIAEAKTVLAKLREYSKLTFGRKQLESKNG